MAPWTKLRRCENWIPGTHAEKLNPSAGETGSWILQGLMDSLPVGLLGKFQASERCCLKNKMDTV